MSRYNRAGGVFDINRSLRKTREEFERAYEDVAAVVSKNTEKGSDNMREITGANTSESKRHYIADEELGGIEREYTETGARGGIARVGDYVVGGTGRICKVTKLHDDGDVNVDTLAGKYNGEYTRSFYKTLSPTDIIRHNGERYRLVDRTAEVGETILVKANEEIWMRDMTVGKMYEVVLDYPGNYVEVMDDVNDPAQAVDGNYYVIEPVIDEQLADAPPEPQPDLIDLVIRLTRKVAELEKEVAAMSDTYDRNRYWTDHRLRIIRETANESDFKAGQALTTAELQQERVEMHSDSIELLTDDIITLDERMGAEEEKSKMITHVLGGSRMCRR